ncbi:MAG: MBL fold metallo-hydrolase [Sandarakinorhabdus sp.]|nr:MBL fold metallo-hydrolase [Sandarakinorhabdus sp.]
MKNPAVTFHGAAHAVTGSCFEIAFGNHRLLVDCGLFQGSRTLESLNYRDFGFEPRMIDAVILTHAHIDHSGLLPRLVARGFDGPIWCTEPTGALLDHMLMDSARIQEGDAAYRNRRPDRADEPQIEPLYRRADSKHALQQLQAEKLDRWFEAAPGFRVRLWNAGHVLGSTSVEIEVGGTRLFFSGDIGPLHKSFHEDPQGPAGVDHLFCEATYGDRSRQSVDPGTRREGLCAEVVAAMARGGNLFVPVFALERTQELLLDLSILMDEGHLPRLTVFIDSPLAINLTDVFVGHRHHLEDTGGRNPFANPAFRFVKDAGQSKRIGRMKGAIILAGSGMCEGGRMRHHLRENLADHRNTLMFVGYQAEGTLGRVLKDGARRVRISGADVAVKAQIRDFPGYSAHADRDELLAWIAARQPISGSIFLVHGETEALRALGSTLSETHSSVIAPEIGERHALPPGGPARKLAGARADLPALTGRDWQNDYAELAVRLKRELVAIEDADRRREAIAEMGMLLRRYQERRTTRMRRSAKAAGG